MDVDARVTGSPRRGATIGPHRPRRAVRWTPALRCRVELACGGERVEGEILDLSDAGLRARFAPERAAELVAGKVFLRCVILLGPHARELSARVAWTTPFGGFLDAGLEFDPAAPQRLRLDLEIVHVDPREALRVPTAVALRRRVLPLCEIGGEIVTACADLSDRSGLDAVARLFGMPVRPQLADPEPLLRTIQRVHGDPRLASQALDAAPSAEVEPLIHAAWLRRASDVHVRPDRDGVHLSLRVDGRLEPYRILPSDAHSELVSRIKVLAGMDIAERRAPQDGRFTFDLPGGARVDVRVATLPTHHGERVTLRLLAIGSESLTLHNLGMADRDLRVCERNLKRPHGMILATGPTGCGKTTTLFAALREITSKRRVNAIALQEPVEYVIPGISQVEIDVHQKISFAGALRSLMRHDPDVILVGEVRDAETASIAIKAALTGHLVLATLHTNSAASAVTRLVDMGVERYLIAATVRLIVAQRLVRRACAGCREPSPLDPTAAFALGAPLGTPAYRTRGCVACAGRGDRGRLGIFEALEIDKAIAEAIRAGAEEPAIEALARGSGMRGLREDALEKLTAGETTAESVLEAVEAAEIEDPDAGGDRA